VALKGLCHHRGLASTAESNLNTVEEKQLSPGRGPLLAMAVHAFFGFFFLLIKVVAKYCEMYSICCCVLFLDWFRDCLLEKVYTDKSFQSFSQTIETKNFFDNN
jgi:hypothetical protein